MSSRAQQPIGIFDSGVGGLTVANAIVKRLPQESFVYVGDTAHLPYGEKSPEAIRQYAFHITNYLLLQGCKMVVIACGSASANAYAFLQQEFGHLIPIVDVVFPLTEAVALRRFRKIGVIATYATIKSGIFARRFAAIAPETEVVSLATPLLVPIIEEGLANTAISRATIAHYLTYPALADAEALLLACTHYPLIKQEIEAFLSPSVQVFDTTTHCAEKVAHTLAEHQLYNSAASVQHRFVVSDLTPNFVEHAKLFYGEAVDLQWLSGVSEEHSELSYSSSPENPTSF